MGTWVKSLKKGKTDEIFKLEHSLSCCLCSDQRIILTECPHCPLDLTLLPDENIDHDKPGKYFGVLYELV